MNPAAEKDVRAALRRRSSAEIAALLLRVPALAEALEGRGPLAGVGRYGIVYPARPQADTAPTLDRLARLLSSAAGIDLCLASLDAFSLQLVTLAVWHGGTLERDDALAEIGSDRAEDLDRAVTMLDELLVIDPQAGWLVLRTGVAAVVSLPGLPVRAYHEQFNSDTLAAMLRRLGADNIPPRKMQRLAALEQRLRDPSTFEAVANQFSDDAARVLEVLLGHGPQRVSDVGVAYYSPWHRDSTPLHELVATGLIGVDAAEQICWVWLDVVVGLNGRLFSSWPPPPVVPTPQPVRENTGLPGVLGRLPVLLSHWAAEPAPALQTGGLGVRPVRAAAKAVGMPPGETGVLATLAVSLGLLGRVHVGTKGRGRLRTDTWAWAPTPLAEQFASLSADQRWALLVQAWRDDPTLDEADGLPERVEETFAPRGSLARSALLRLLLSLPPGTGLPLEKLIIFAESSTSGTLHGPAIGHVVDGARILGLVPPDEPVGLTSLGRALLDSPATLAAALPAPRSEFTVQGDLSVVAPPDLAPDVAGHLERYAELESTAGARLYRLAERRIGAALDAGDTADAILSFLAEYSTVPLAQNVEYLIRDCERRHGRLRAGGCASYVRSDDPGALTSAVGVKAAKLRLLAPTVAVSSLPRTKVVAALRAKGLMPVAEDADGVALPPQTAIAAPSKTAGHDLPALREAVEVRPADAEALAEKVLAAAELVTDDPRPRNVPNGRRPNLDALIVEQDGNLDEVSELLRRYGRGG